MTTRLASITALSLLLAALAACSSVNWERSFYDGARIGADNAAQLPGPAAIPQTTRLPDHDHYVQERERLRGRASEPAASAPDAAASMAAR